MEKTNRLFFDKLPQEWQEKYKSNFIEQKPEQDFEQWLDLPCITMWKFFGEGFRFKNSKEGMKFWISVRRKLTGR